MVTAGEPSLLRQEPMRAVGRHAVVQRVQVRPLRATTEWRPNFDERLSSRQLGAIHSIARRKGIPPSNLAVSSRLRVRRVRVTGSTDMRQVPNTRTALVLTFPPQRVVAAVQGQHPGEKR